MYTVIWENGVLNSLLLLLHHQTYPYHHLMHRLPQPLAFPQQQGQRHRRQQLELKNKQLQSDCKVKPNSYQHHRQEQQQHRRRSSSPSDPSLIIHGCSFPQDQ